MIKLISQNKVFQFSLAVLSIILTVVFYFNSIKEMQPIYAVSKFESLASINEEIPNLKILWKDKKIPKLVRQKLIFFNNGKQYIDKNNISITDPISIIIPKDSVLLQAKVETTSRKNLKFSLQRVKNKIVVNIVGDDALEYKDGALITLLYSGSQISVPKVKGRIKGSKTDFVKIKWEKVNSSNKNLLVLMSSSIITSILILLDIRLESLLISSKNRKGVFRIFNMIKIMKLMIVAVVLTEGYEFMANYYYNIPWLVQ